MISLSYLRHKKNGRKIIVGEVYWEEGAKAHDLQGILDMYSKKGNELENRAYSEPMREGRLIQSDVLIHIILNIFKIHLFNPDTIYSNCVLSTRL